VCAGSSARDGAVALWNSQDQSWRAAESGLRAAAESARIEQDRFKHGLDDLEESARLLARRGVRPGRRLARAYLNRAHEALNAGRVDLARAALARAWRTSPAATASALADPRLGLPMGLLALAPRLARRRWGR